MLTVAGFGRGCFEANLYAAQDTRLPFAGSHYLTSQYGVTVLSKPCQLSSFGTVLRLMTLDALSHEKASPPEASGNECGTLELLPGSLLVATVG